MVIVGPTAVGKTDLSLEIAGQSFEIISADSVQVYRYLDIGSGKPDPEQRRSVRHHVIDVVMPDHQFTAGEFCRCAADACRLIESRGKIPLFTGGTGLYVDSFFSGLDDIPPVDGSVRKEILRQLGDNGLDFLYDELCSVDPLFAGSIHPNDRQRIIRGLEVYRGLGRPLSGFFGRASGKAGRNTLFIGLRREREELRKRINLRVDGMMRKGLVDEVRSLREMGYGPELKSMNSLGYRQINACLDGKCDQPGAVDAIKTETARFAKRQMTWFNRNRDVHWFDAGAGKSVDEFIKVWLNANA